MNESSQSNPDRLYLEVGSREWNRREEAKRRARVTSSGAEKTKTYGDMVMERVSTISKDQQDLLQDAVDRGIPESEFRKLIADAINGEKLARVVEGFRQKDGMSLVLLNESVTPDLFDVTAKYVPMLSGNGTRFESRVSYGDWPDDQLSHEWLTVPTSESRPVDTEVLAKIDAHMLPHVADQA